MLKSGISKKHSQIHCRCFIMKIFTRLQSELMHIWPPKTWSIFNLVVFNLIWCFLTCSRLKFTSSWNTQVMIFNMNILKVTSWTTFSHRELFSRSPLLMFVPIALIICLTFVRETECSSHQYSSHSCGVWAQLNITGETFETKRKFPTEYDEELYIRPRW